MTTQSPEPFKALFRYRLRVNRINSKTPDVLNGELMARKPSVKFSATTKERLAHIRESCILFFVHQTYSPTSPEQENYDSVRQFWRIGEATRTPPLVHQLALGVVEGVVVRAYSIEAWFPAGATFSSREWSGGGGAKPLWEFVGKPLPDHPLLDRLLVDDEGKRIRGCQIGYYYLPRH
jgi:uncharacterized protein